MMRNIAAAVLGCIFLVLFCFSGLTASTAAKDVAVSTQMSLPKLFFSLSSAGILLIPLSIATMICAIIAYLSKQRNVGFLFSAVSTVSFLLFVLFFPQEQANSALYAALSGLLKEAGVKFRARDVEGIRIVLSPLSYITLACAGATMLCGMPDARGDVAKRKLKKDLLPYAYIAPHLFFFIIFFLTPAVYGVYAAFTKWNLFQEPEFIGLANFKTLLFDPANTYYKQLRNGLWNTFKFVLYSVPLCIITPLSLAVALHAKSKGSKFFQAIYFFPSLLSITTVTLSWQYMFKPQYGMVTKFLGSTSNWFAPPLSWIVVVIVTVWWCNGNTMVIYQSAMASIPQDRFEAAEVVGANAWQRFCYITLPGMRYPLTYTFVITMVAQFNIYGQPLILTGFKNNEANAVLLMYIQENAVKKQVAGMSAAMALILGLCIIVVSFIQMKLMKENSSV